jgi:predicted RNase H-like HicB family nuclease
MTDYVGIIDQSGKTWGVRIPELPGCYGAGDSAENAIRDAASAAGEWIVHHERSGLARPKARAMSEILDASEVDVAAGEMTVLIRGMTNGDR